MNISFKGINNIRIAKKEQRGFGMYLDNAGEIKQGEKEITSIKLSCEVTDDKYGNDFTALKEHAERSGSFIRLNCINEKEPNKIELLIKRVSAKDDVFDKCTTSLINMNGHDIPITDKKQLAMYTYLAGLTRKMSNLPNISDAQKVYVDMVNQSVHEEAVKFIDSY